MPDRLFSNCQKIKPIKTEAPIDWAARATVSPLLRFTFTKSLAVLQGSKFNKAWLKNGPMDYLRQEKRIYRTLTRKHSATHELCERPYACHLPTAHGSRLKSTTSCPQNPALLGGASDLVGEPCSAEEVSSAMIRCWQIDTSIFHNNRSAKFMGAAKA